MITLQAGWYNGGESCSHLAARQKATLGGRQWWRLWCLVSVGSSMKNFKVKPESLGVNSCPIGKGWVLQSSPLMTWKLRWNVLRSWISCSFERCYREWGPRSFHELQKRWMFESLWKHSPKLTHIIIPPYNRHYFVDILLHGGILLPC